MPITITRLDKPFWVVCGDSRVQVDPRPEAREAIGAELRACIIGWENVMDQDGLDVPFAEGLVDRLPWEVLLRALRCKRGLDDPLADRSGASSTPSSDAPDGKTPTPA
jgi:hypothetical protein